MIDPELLSILCCPETHADLFLASAEQLKIINEAITDGIAKNHAGETVTEPIEEALIRADGLYAYPIRDEIPIMLIDQAISLRDLCSSSVKNRDYVTSFATR